MSSIESEATEKMGILFQSFGVELTEKTVEIFDNATGKHCGEHQPVLGCMSALLEVLETFPEDGTDITVPILCKLRALQAAYHLGYEQGRNLNER